MPVTKKGFDKLQKRLKRVVPLARQKFEAVNMRNAEDVATIARVLIPEESGRARSLIRTFPWPGGGHAIDFGQLAKILEGGTEERTTKTGQSRGRGPASPFVNPAFGATRNRRKARNRKAGRDAWKQADG